MINKQKLTPVRIKLSHEPIDGDKGAKGRPGKGELNGKTATCHFLEEKTSSTYPGGGVFFDQNFALKSMIRRETEVTLICSISGRIKLLQLVKWILDLILLEEKVQLTGNSCWHTILRLNT